MQVQVGHRHLSTRNGFGIDKKAACIHPEDQVEGDIEAVDHLTLQRKLAVKTIDIDLTFTGKTALQLHIESHGGVRLGKTYIIRDVIEVIQDRAQNLVVGNGIADFLDKVAEGTAVEKSSDDGAAALEIIHGQTLGCQGGS